MYVCVCASGKDSWELKASVVWGSATKGSEGASVSNPANTLPVKKENKICDDLRSKLNKWKTSVTLDEEVNVCFVMVTLTTQMLMTDAIMNVYAGLCKMKTWLMVFERLKKSLKM